MTVRRVIFWRHGRTQWNHEGRFQGHEDVGLDATGRAQAVTVAPVVARLGFDAIVCSDLVRARDTAAAVAAVTGLPVSYDQRLREARLGRWQGLTLAQAREQLPEEYAEWAAGRQRPSVEPNGEVGVRMAAALADVDAEQVLAVSHGGSIRSALVTLLGLREVDRGALAPLSNCRWSILEADGDRWTLDQHNIDWAASGGDAGWAASGMPQDHSSTAVDDALATAARDDLPIDKRRNQA